VFTQCDGLDEQLPPHSNDRRTQPLGPALASVEMADVQVEALSLQSNAVQTEVSELWTSHNTDSSPGNSTSRE
jgi:hypothetical protein